MLVIYMWFQIIRLAKLLFTIFAFKIPSSVMNCNNMPLWRSIVIELFLHSLHSKSLAPWWNVLTLTYTGGVKFDSPLPKIRSHQKTTKGYNHDISWLFIAFYARKDNEKFSGRAVPWVRKWKSDIALHGRGQIWHPIKSHDSIQNPSKRHVNDVKCNFQRLFSWIFLKWHFGPVFTNFLTFLSNFKNWLFSTFEFFWRTVILGSD